MLVLSSPHFLSSIHPSIHSQVVVHLFIGSPSIHPFIPSSVPSLFFLFWFFPHHPSINFFIHSFIHSFASTFIVFFFAFSPSIHPSNSSVIHSSIRSSVYLPIHPSIHSQVVFHPLFNVPFVRQPLIHSISFLLIRPSVDLLVRSSIHPEVDPTIYSSIYFSIYSFFHPFVYLSVCPSINHGKFWKACRNRVNMSFFPASLRHRLPDLPGCSVV